MITIPLDQRKTVTLSAKRLLRSVNDALVIVQFIASSLRECHAVPYTTEYRRSSLCGYTQLRA